MKIEDIKKVSIEEFRAECHEMIERMIEVCTDDGIVPIGFLMVFNAEGQGELETGLGDNVFCQAEGHWSRDEMSRAIRELKDQRDKMSIVRHNFEDLD